MRPTSIQLLLTTVAIVCYFEVCESKRRRTAGHP
jgi:hypothetical protein